VFKNQMGAKNPLARNCTDSWSTNRYDFEKNIFSSRVDFFHDTVREVLFPQSCEKSILAIFYPESKSDLRFVIHMKN
jgi:hypothetical protein